jgi:hypothetical protein
VKPTTTTGAKLGWVTATALAAVMVAVGFFYGWTVQTTSAEMRPNGQKSDYYNLLVDGFRDGHLYMKVAVDPQLLALRPEQRPGSAPYLLDASLYEGRYYLYFGVTPAVLLFWPFAAVTGHDLPEATGALIFMLLGFGLATAWWLDVRRAYFPRLAGGWTVLAVLAIGLCTAAPSALRRPMFYEVAIGSGYAFSMLALWAATRAWQRPERSRGWLLLAGVAVGLAVGSRANLAPAGLALLGLACCGVAWPNGRAGRARRLALALLAAGSGAGGIGAGLAAYNYARFGSIVEFGHSHQLGQNPKQMFRAENLWHNVKLYYLKPPALNGYFPFVAPADESAKPADYIGREHVHGEWLWTLIFGVALGSGGWVALRRRGADARVWCGALMLPALAFIVNGIVVGMTGVRSNRYMLDFHPALVLSTLALIALALDAAGRGRAARLLGWCVALLIPMASAFNVLASMQVHGFFVRTAPQSYATLASLADRIVWPALLTERAAVGDRQINLRWPAGVNGSWREPLLSSGTMDFTDILWIEYDGPKRARFIFQHGEYGDAQGEWFDYESGKRARVEISGALLLPGVAHPWYGERPPEERLALKRRLRILVDTKPVFSRDVVSYDSSPRLQRWGEWRRSDSQVFKFRGDFLRVLPVPVGDDGVRELDQARGPVRLQLQLPRERMGVIEPLLQSGGPTTFDTLAVRYVRDGVVQLLHDQAGGGGRWSDEFPADYAKPHLVEVELPFATDGVVWMEKGPVETRKPPVAMRVRWNGREVFAPLLAPVAAERSSIFVGVNWWNSSVTRALFGGAISEFPALLPLKPVGGGGLDWDWSVAGALAGDRGVAVQFTRADHETAALVWQRTGDPERGPLRLGWVEAGQVVWSPELDGSSLTAGAPRLQIPDGVAGAAEAVAGWLEVESGGRPLLAHKTTFFGNGPVDARAVLPETWSGSALRRISAPGVAEAPRLPGRVRIRFLLPAGGYVGSDPLFSAGRTGAADSIFMRGLGNGRYVLGLDHWSVGSTESQPVMLAAGEVHTLVLELGSLAGAGEFPPDHVRLILDERVVLDTKLSLFPTKPEEIVYGRNPLGMSTSSPEFRGEIVSIRTHVSAAELR